MAVSLAELILLSLLVDWMFRKLRIPGLVGMLFVGVVLGPYVLGNLNPALLAISARSEEHTSELQSHSFISYAVFCLKKKNH